MEAEEPEALKVMEDRERPYEPVNYRNILGSRVGLPVPEEELPW